MSQNRPTRNELKSKVRPDRIPVYEANRNKITVAGLDNENFMYRWVNDTEGRIDMFLNAQWELVQKEGLKVGDGGVDSSARTSSAMSKGMGGGVVAYLMRIPKDIWLMDQARKETEEIASLEADMKRNAGNSADYGKLNIETKRS